MLAATAAVLCVLAAVVYALQRFPSEAFGFFGLWLFVYRFVGRWCTSPDSRERWLTETVTSFITGASLALLAPLLSWPSPPVCLPMLVVIGALFSMCSVWFSAVLSSVIIGTAVGALLWQLGLCSAAAWAHCGLLTLSAVICTAVFSCNARAEPFFPWVLIALAALLVVESLGPYVPSVGVLPIGELFVADPSCPDEELSRMARNTGLAWLALTACIVALQTVILGNSAPDDGCTNPELADSLLSNSTGAANRQGEGGLAAGDDGFTVPKKDGGLNRHPVLIQAMFAPEGTDQSHLTEHEKKLVTICRENEDERNRVMFGGGLY